MHVCVTTSLVPFLYTDLTRIIPNIPIFGIILVKSVYPHQSDLLSSEYF